MALTGDPTCYKCRAYVWWNTRTNRWICPNSCDNNTFFTVGPAHMTFTEKQTKFDFDKVKEATRLLLEGIGDDPSRDGLKDTPDRVAKMYSEILNGYDLDASDCITQFDNDGDYDGPVCVQDIPIYSFCEHHLALFAGKLHIAYEPRDKIVGLSKLIRISRVYAKRLQVQEKLTKQIADAVWDNLNPHWCVVKIEAEHFCISIRGVRAPNTNTKTITGYGDYPEDIFNE